MSGEENNIYTREFIYSGEKTSIESKYKIVTLMVMIHIKERQREREEKREGGIKI